MTKSFNFRSYFSENGIEYNLCRVPIGGTDFSTHSYSLDDGAADPTLENFQLAEEDLNIKVILFKPDMNILTLRIFQLLITRDYNFFS